MATNAVMELVHLSISRDMTLLLADGVNPVASLQEALRNYRKGVPNERRTDSVRAPSLIAPPYRELENWTGRREDILELQCQSPRTSASSSPHTVLIFPVVYLVLSATYSSIDPRLSLAAASLGANPWRVFRTVVFPLLLPGMAIGALLAMLLSFDESVASIFLSDLSVKILPRKPWEGIRFNTSPESAAVSVMMLGVTCSVIAIGATVTLGRRRNALLKL